MYEGERLNRKYIVALIAITIVLVVFRVGYSLAVWGGSVDPDPWKLIGDTNKYVVTGHYSPSATQSMYLRCLLSRPRSAACVAHRFYRH